MEKMVITDIKRYDKKADGTPYIGKNGKPFEIVKIKTDKYGEQVISCWGSFQNKSWKAGDTVTLKITKELYNGKESLKGEAIKESDAVIESLIRDIKDIKDRLYALEHPKSMLQPDNSVDF